MLFLQLFFGFQCPLTHLCCASLSDISLACSRKYPAAFLKAFFLIFARVSVSFISITLPRLVTQIPNRLAGWINSSWNNNSPLFFICPHSSLINKEMCPPFLPEYAAVSLYLFWANNSSVQEVSLACSKIFCAIWYWLGTECDSEIIYVFALKSDYCWHCSYFLDHSHQSIPSCLSSHFFCNQNGFSLQSFGGCLHPLYCNDL